MSTQLHLITSPDPVPAPAPSRRPARDSAPDSAPRRPRRARVARPGQGRDRRAAHWSGAWRLDARTRAVGRAGVASAKAALARAHGSDGGDGADRLRQAS